MSTTPEVERAAPDPARVRQLVPQLDQLDQRMFARVVAEVVTGQRDDPSLEAALRTPALAAKTLDAVKFHIDEANANIRKAEGESKIEARRRQEHFRHRMGVWRRQLEMVVAGVRAQRGLVPNAPNPRQRAYERLVGTTITAESGERIDLYPVFRRILEDEKAKVKRRRREQRKAAKRRR